MNKSLYVEFQQHSQDFLRLIGDKSREAERSKTAERELGILEFFWNGVEEIFKKYEEQALELRLLSVNEHAKSVILRNELKGVYNDLYKLRNKIPQEIAEMMARKSVAPTLDEFKQDITV